MLQVANSSSSVSKDFPTPTISNLLGTKFSNRVQFVLLIVLAILLIKSGSDCLPMASHNAVNYLARSSCAHEQKRSKLQTLNFRLERHLPML